MCTGWSEAGAFIGIRLFGCFTATAIATARRAAIATATDGWL